jgi:hypothetical protein
MIITTTRTLLAATLICVLLTAGCARRDPAMDAIGVEESRGAAQGAGGLPPNEAGIPHLTQTGDADGAGRKDRTGSERPQPGGRTPAQEEHRSDRQGVSPTGGQPH